MNGKQMAADVLAAVKSYVERASRPLADRIIALENRAAVPGKDGADGKDGKDGIGKDGKDGLNGVDGKSVSLEEVRPLVREAIESIPKPLPGRDGKDGADGKSVTVDDVTGLIAREVSKAVS